VTAEPIPAGAARLPATDTPREVRATLLPDEVGQFDSEWRAAMSRAAEALDLAEVYAVLDRWRFIARLTQVDPEAHRRMLAKAERSLSGGPEPSVPVDEIRALIRRRLDA
jgi:hypothetical protein